MSFTWSLEEEFPNALSTMEYNTSSEIEKRVYAYIELILNPRLEQNLFSMISSTYPMQYTFLLAKIVSQML